MQTQPGIDALSIISATQVFMTLLQVGNISNQYFYTRHKVVAKVNSS